jgi:tubulin polyglutamylase TTLL9
LLCSLQEADAYVVQRYIDNPYLVGGKKFDLRLYVVVTSYSPLNVWIYRSGFARFTNARYNSDVSDITNNFMHLTNVAIQKTAEDYDKRTGGKWDLRRLKLHMISQFGQETTDAVFWEMQMIIIRSLLSAQGVMINDKHCFELYGYDIMIDDTLKPWLIEVNASPSLSANTQEDYVMKCEMLNDVLGEVESKEFVEL